MGRERFGGPLKPDPTPEQYSDASKRLDAQPVQQPSEAWYAWTDNSGMHWVGHVEYDHMGRTVATSVYCEELAERIKAQ